MMATTIEVPAYHVVPENTKSTLWMVTENSKGMGCLKSQTRTFLGKEHCMKGISGGVGGGDFKKTIHGGVVDIFCNNTLYMWLWTQYPSFATHMG